MIRFDLVTPPTEEPVTLDEVKEFARVESAAEDGLIGKLITTARMAVERATGRVLVSQEWIATLDRWPVAEDGLRQVELANLPIASIDAVTVDDVAIAAGDYALARDMLRIKSGVADSAAELGGGIAIEFTAGYGAAADVPADLAQAVKQLAAHLFEHREVAVSGFAGFPMPYSVDALLAPFKVLKI